MDKVVGVVTLRKRLRDVVEGASRGSRYIITSRSQPKAVLLSIEELETLEVMADHDLLDEIRQAKEDIKAGRYIPFDQYFGAR